MEKNKTKQRDFYIGWQDRAPAPFARTGLRLTLVLALVLPLVAAGLVLTQRGFADSVFEFGQLREIEGWLVLDPVPQLKILASDVADERPAVKSILLLGFGKRGAEADIERWRAEHGDALFKRPVRLRGTLLYHDGKTLLELSEGPAAWVAWAETSSPWQPRREVIGEVKLRGEIYDPKCAFGVMKPGHGKPHRSCAIRCISGGIPPVLCIRDEGGQANYLLLLDRAGQRLHQRVLPYVGDQIQVCGQLVRQDDWLYLYTDPNQDLLRLQPHWMEGDLRMCAE